MLAVCWLCVDLAPEPHASIGAQSSLPAAAAAAARLLRQASIGSLQQGDTLALLGDVVHQLLHGAAHVEHLSAAALAANETVAPTQQV